MNQENIIQQTMKFVQEKLEGEGSGHDWWHVYRVWKNSLKICKEEKVDLFVVQLAALLHDIADFKLHCGDEEIGPKTAKDFLTTLNVETEIIEHVCEIIRTVSFKGAKVNIPVKTLEGKVVQDADRLDAMGAMGISRCFAYGGSQGRSIYDPGIKPKMHKSFEEYKKSNTPSITHFYEKLLLLKDRMNTRTGKLIAKKRHDFMTSYLDRFFEEWEGKS